MSIASYGLFNNMDHHHKHRQRDRPAPYKLNHIITDRAHRRSLTPNDEVASPIVPRRVDRMSIHSLLNGSEQSSTTTSPISSVGSTFSWGPDRRFSTATVNSQASDVDNNMQLPSYRELISPYEQADYSYPSSPYSMGAIPSARGSISSASSASNDMRAYHQSQQPTKRPNFPYNFEEIDFITYHREDLGNSWQEIWPKFNKWLESKGLDKRQRGGKPGGEQDGRQAVQGIYYRNKGFPTLDDNGNPIYDESGKPILAAIKVRQRQDEKIKKSHLLALKLVDRFPRRILERNYEWVRPEHKRAAEERIAIEESGKVLSYEKLVQFADGYQSKM